MMNKVLWCVGISGTLFSTNVNDPAWSFLFNEKGIATLFYILRLKYVLKPVGALSLTSGG